jgi:hypothetical protein
METYTLTSKGRPATIGSGQALRLYEVMEELGGGPISLDKIVEKCEYRNYAALLETETSVTRSVKHDLVRNQDEKPGQTDSVSEK